VVTVWPIRLYSLVSSRACKPEQKGAPHRAALAVWGVEQEARTHDLQPPPPPSCEAALIGRERSVAGARLHAGKVHGPTRMTADGGQYHSVDAIVAFRAAGRAITRAARGWLVGCCSHEGGILLTKKNSRTVSDDVRSSVTCRRGVSASSKIARGSRAVARRRCGRHLRND
jgi:hypothetical protein